MSAKLKNAIRAVNRTALMLGSVSTLAISTAAFAQQEGALMEEIEVTGIRGSLKQAIDNKRFSNAVLDSVTAEDIGKFPDNNVAESLGRVPGVTVSRQFGEGSAISIRGASNQLTLTTLYGQNVASAGWYSQQAIDRTFNYSLLPPEMIAGMDVYKSSQADLLEGGVGGTVVVKTRKPLDLDANTIFGSVKGTYSSASEDWDPSYSALYSWKNDAETFGVLVAGAYSEYNLVRRGDEALPAWGGRIAPVNFDQNRDRTAFDVAAQFAPTDALEFGLHYMNLELEADGVNTAIWIPQDLNNCSSTNAQGVPTSCTASNGSAGDSYWDVRPRLATMETELWDATVDFEGNGYTLSGQVGTSEATGGTNFETNVAYISGVGGADGNIDATGSTVDYNLTNPVFPLPAAGEYAGWEGLQTGSIVKQPRTDEETYAQVDVEFEVDFGAINSIKTGLRWSDHEVEQDAFRPVLNYDGAAEAALLDAAYFTSGTLKAGNDHFTVAAPSGSTMVDYTKSKITGWTQQRSGFSNVEEENIAAYVMANFEGDNFRGNFGFRYVDTEASSEYYVPNPLYVDPDGINSGYSTVIGKAEGEYREVLPSINMTFDLADDVLLRMSAAQVMSRPNYDDMFAFTAVQGYNDTIPGNGTVVTGNPALSPFKANQADLGIEWYYGDGNLLSATYFIKNVDTFTTFGNEEGVSIGLPDPDDGGADSWLAQTKIDGKGGQIEGLELQAQHDFGNGFGLVGNYTYADPSAEGDNYSDGNPIFSDASKHTVNFVGYYENDVFSARAAYSWRSEYMILETGFYGAREHQDFGTLDLSFSWHVTDNITLLADATNVLEEDSVQVGADKGDTATFWRTSNGYPAYSYEGEARYSLGAQFRF